MRAAQIAFYLFARGGCVCVLLGRQDFSLILQTHAATLQQTGANQQQVGNQQAEIGTCSVFTIYILEHFRSVT
jgi:hypothetical protein